MCSVFVLLYVCCMYSDTYCMYVCILGNTLCRLCLLCHPFLVIKLIMIIIIIIKHNIFLGSAKHTFKVCVDVNLLNNRKMEEIEKNQVIYHSN